MSTWRLLFKSGGQALIHALSIQDAASRAMNYQEICVLIELITWRD